MELKKFEENPAPSTGQNPNDTSAPQPEAQPETQPESQPGTHPDAQPEKQPETQEGAPQDVQPNGHVLESETIKLPTPENPVANGYAESDYAAEEGSISSPRGIMFDPKKGLLSAINTLMTDRSPSLAALASLPSPPTEQLTKISDLTAKIQEESLDLGESQYNLHAVFHHEGSAEFGHYWIYILDDQADDTRWLKYSDDRIEVVRFSLVSLKVRAALVSPDPNSFVSFHPRFPHRRKRAKCSAEPKDPMPVSACTRAPSQTKCRQCGGVLWSSELYRSCIILDK